MSFTLPQIQNPKSKIQNPLISVCIPHWQVRGLIAMCLRSLRKHSAGCNVEILVVDNGSRDESLEYLRSLPWIRLIERPDEGPANWPANVFTAWDLGLREARGEYFVTMHTDVLLRREGLLPRLLVELDGQPSVAGVGAWKLDLAPAWYLWQKEFVGGAVARVKSWLGRPNRGAAAGTGRKYPRDYFAIYRRDVLLQHNLTFCPGDDALTGGFAIARQLWAQGFETRLIPTHEMSQYLVHVAHGTAALAADKPLHHRSAQRKVERRVAQLFAQRWVQSLRDDPSLDAA